MGWRLAEEVAWARPKRPDPEWWTLLDIAQDADDDTRQGWPGHEYLTARARCSRRTIDRRIGALADAGLIKIAAKAAPGRRVVYEILILHGRPVDNSGTCDTSDVARQRATSGGQRATSDPGAVTSGNAATPQVTEPGSVAHPPSVLPSLPPSKTLGVLTSPVPVENARARSGQTRMSDREATEAERQRQHDALNEWMRQHPEAAP